MAVNLKKESQFRVLQKTYGLGKVLALSAIKKVGLNVQKKHVFLKKQKTKKLKAFTNRFKINKILKYRLNLLHRFYLKLKTYRSVRNKFKYPCRGQRTKTNAKTKKKFKLELSY